jgi:hypothetical protein
MYERARSLVPYDQLRTSRMRAQPRESDLPWVFPHDGVLGRLAAYRSADALRARLHQAHIPADTAKDLQAMLEKALASPGATVACPYAELSDEQLGISGFH